MRIQLQRTTLQCLKSLKPYTLTRFEPTITWSGGARAAINAHFIAESPELAMFWFLHICIDVRTGLSIQREFTPMEGRIM
jgi:hypothetical protein